MTNKAKPSRVLFLCTGNSCRSQMAEGWARELHPGRIEAYSAGSLKHGLNLHAVRVMAERGIDIGGHYSKTLDDLEGVSFELVMTVCGNAHESCPVFPGESRVVHRGFDDPPQLTENVGSPEEAINQYRRVRDEIEEYVRDLPELLR